MNMTAFRVQQAISATSAPFVLSYINLVLVYIEVQDTKQWLYLCLVQLVVKLVCIKKIGVSTMTSLGQISRVKHTSIG